MATKNKKIFRVLGGNMNEDIKITYAKKKTKQGAVLKVFGVGGAGGNAINRMIDENLKGVEFIAVNTDDQDLSSILEPAKTLQIGSKITKGLGTGSNAEIGMQAAMEDSNTIIEALEGSNMVFITAGMGGGTGTGASQVVANHASAMDILSVAVVTKPFEFEGDSRMNVANEGVQKLMEIVDAIIIIPNQKLYDMEDQNISYKDAYKKVDQILIKAVKGISDIIKSPGYQQIDFADVKSTMTLKGMTLMGTGEAKGENRAETATLEALNSPLLDNISIKGATGILYNITASSSLSLGELGIISNMIKDNAADDAKIKFGIVDEEGVGDMLRVTVIATGFKGEPERLHSSTQVTTNYFRESDNQEIKKDPSQQHNYVFKPENQPPREHSVDLTAGYLSESTVPSMLQNPENIEDPLDIPTFGRDFIRGNND